MGEILFWGILGGCWSSVRASLGPGQRRFCAELCQINACPGFSSSPPPSRVLMWVSACELVWRLSFGRGRVIAFANFRAQSPLGTDNLPVQYIFVSWERFTCLSKYSGFGKGKKYIYLCVYVTFCVCVISTCI